MDELPYENDEGDTVYTSQYLKNRGHCCNTNCLHCPFGTTLKNLGVQFSEVNLNQIKAAEEIILGKKVGGNDISASLLTGAFGKPSRSIDISSKNIASFKFILIKNTRCGLAHLGESGIKDIFLLPHFQNQGLDKDTVQSYLEF